MQIKSETVKLITAGDWGSGFQSGQEQNAADLAEATLLSLCDWIKVGLALLPALWKPQVFPAAGSQRPTEGSPWHQIAPLSYFSQVKNRKLTVQLFCLF